MAALGGDRSTLTGLDHLLQDRSNDDRMMKHMFASLHDMFEVGASPDRWLITGRTAPTTNYKNAKQRCSAGF